MLSSLVLWSCLAGLAFLGMGLFFVRAEVAAGSVQDKIIALGYVFVAAPLAVFGTEHLLASRSLAALVPHWVPGPLSWVYFVGMALFAAALSLILKKHLRWSAPLLGTMFLVFVLSIHIPNVIAHAKERLYWTVMLRDLAFAGGALALAGSTRRQDGARIATTLITVGRICIAVPLIFFAIEHFLFPKFAPGVPLSKLTPPWVPVPALWAYAVGAVLLISGAAMLLNKSARTAAAYVGLVMMLLTLFLYLPILLKAFGTPLAVEGVNYVSDTLLFGGTVLFLGLALEKAH